MAWRKPLAHAAIIAALALVATNPAFAQKKYGPGVTDKEIKIGTTTPFSGPASAYSAGAVSATAYFQKVNDEGGVNGRKINYVALDDAYSPPKTVEQIRRLIESEEVLFLVNPVGTATNMAVVKYINQKKVPHLFIGTGATVFNDPEHYPWTLSWTPHYASEGEIYAKWILSNKPEAKVGILSQNDDLGRDYLMGFKRGLGDRADKMIVSQQTYNTHRSHGGFADRVVEGRRRRRAADFLGAEIRRASDPQGLRHRLASAGVRLQRRLLDCGRDQAGRLRGGQGHHLGGLPEGPLRSAMARRPGDEGLECVDGQIQSACRQERLLRALWLQYRPRGGGAARGNAATISRARTSWTRPAISTWTCRCCCRASG